MKCVNVPPKLQLPPLGERGYLVATSNHGKVIRTRRSKRPRKLAVPSAVKIMLGGQTAAQWRRAWWRLLCNFWDYTMAPADKAWWVTQSAIVPFKNSRGIPSTANGKSFYLWYQFRRFDLRLNRYMPFPANAADFPFYFSVPWSPPTIAAPSIVSASHSGLLTLRCKNQAPDTTPVLPWACFSIWPPLRKTTPASRRAWFHYSHTDNGTDTDYNYNLGDIWPKMRVWTTATMTHCYGEPSTVATAAHSHGVFTTSGTVSRGRQPWTGDANILDYSASVATATDTPDYWSWQTDWIKAQGVTWTPAIPDSTPIVGFIVEFMANHKTADFRAYLQHVHLLKAGTPTTWYDTGMYVPLNETFPWAYTPIGSATAKWGTTWTGADLNDALFGIYLYMQAYNDLTDTTVEIAHVKITAYYAGSFGWFTPPAETQFVFT